jgi:hypothetical protein
MKQSYKGPAKPIPVKREIISDRAELIWFVVLAVVFVVIEVIPWD